jgi:hypothetical protein
VAFVIGFFPLVGLQLLQRVTSKVLGVIVPPITSEYPLDQLDGLNLWYEARLTEEGVEDMQNLTTMNLVDVILHTRVPPGRLVDWTDQAFLLIHLDKTDRGELNDLRQKLRQQRQGRQDATAADPEPCAEFGAEARLNLRRVGIRTATDLLKAFSKEAEQPHGSRPERIFAPQQQIKRLPLPESQLRLLVSVLGSEPGLVPIWNWQQNGPKTFCPVSDKSVRGQSIRPVRVSSLTIKSEAFPAGATRAPTLGTPHQHEHAVEAPLRVRMIGPDLLTRSPPETDHSPPCAAAGQRDLSKLVLPWHHELDCGVAPGAD